MQPYTLGTAAIISTPKPSELPDLYTFSLTEGKDITIESEGDADIRLDIFGPFTDIQQSVPPGAISRLHVLGVAKWNTGPLIEGNYLIAVTQNTPGHLMFKVREWRYADAIQVPMRRTI